MHEDDARLRATLTRVVLTELRSGRAHLSHPAVAALRILAEDPGTALPEDPPARRPPVPLRRAAAAARLSAGVGVLAGAVLAGALLLADGDSDAPQAGPESAPAVAAPSTRTPGTTDRTSGAAVVPGSVRPPASADKGPEGGPAGPPSHRPATAGPPSARPAAATVPQSVHPPQAGGGGPAVASRTAAASGTAATRGAAPTTAESPTATPTPDPTPASTPPPDPAATSAAPSQPPAPTKDPVPTTAPSGAPSVTPCPGSGDAAE